MKIKICWIIVSISMLLIGCSLASKDNELPSTEPYSSGTERQEITAGEAEQQEASTGETETGQPEALAMAPDQQPDETIPTTEPSEVPTRSDEASKVSRPITETELKEIEDFINGKKPGSYYNYGYLQSAYLSPEYADLDLIFYTGAGMSSESQITEAEILAYEEANEFFDLDMVRLTTAQIDQFLQETAGIRFKDHKGSFSSYYLPEFDAYYHETGDTNFVEYVCLDGVVENNQYKVHCSCSSYDCMTAFRKTGNSYQFISNQYIVSGKDVKDIDELNYLISNIYTDGLPYSLIAYRSDYIYQSDFNSTIFDTDQRYYTKEQLLKINPYLLEIARNEIYARHGYIFKSSRLKEFFSQYSWYQEKYPADTFSDNLLNQYEKANRDLIRSFEIWND